MTEQTRYFHFTLGPVQGFVAQARRTRDFWAGSFLLSWLAGVAMQAVKLQGGSIVFPIPDDNFLKALSGEKVTRVPLQGGIPNRFMADISSCHDFSGQAVTHAVQQVWLAITDSVWQKDKAGLWQQGYNDTKTIWDRQVSQFWDMSWVITQGRDTSALDKRKNFRTHTPSVEGGYKCMMMEGFTELSGASDKNSGKKRRDYWTQLSHKIHAKDIGENEQLCAIAYVKRRFVHSFDKVKANIDVNGKTLSIYGWNLPHNVPSVAYMAAVPWLKVLLSSSEPKVASAFKSFILALEEMKYFVDTDISHSEKRNHVNSIAMQAKSSSIRFSDISLDGNIYYANFWDNIGNFVADKQNYDGNIDKYRPKLKNALKDLQESMNGFEASPYYAILLMDGDSLGKQMSHESRQPVISEALNTFTQRAEAIVKSNDGFLIYAGGDDVLALLSLDDAMTTANALRNAYVLCFEESSKKHQVMVHSTLSGAINYCHVGTPLTQVLSDSHDLLDNIAKDKTGRNALAVRVWKPSGQAVQWSLPWEKVVDSQVIDVLNQNFEQSFTEYTPIIEGLARVMEQQKSSDKNISVFSTSFFYKTRELMKMLEQMMHDASLSTDNAKKLLLAEYLQSGDFRNISAEQQRQLTTIFGILIEQSRDYRSVINDGKASIDVASGNKLTGDAGILLRILGQKGLGKGDKA